MLGCGDSPLYLVSGKHSKQHAKKRPPVVAAFKRRSGEAARLFLNMNVQPAGNSVHRHSPSFPTWLPSPDQVRAASEEMGTRNVLKAYNPPPVKFPSLGLLVKFGCGIFVEESRSQEMIYSRLNDQVPVPKIFACVEDQRQVFIYMALIDADTLKERWGEMNEIERLAICKELRTMVKAWRGLQQEPDDRFVGSIGKQPLRDKFLRRDKFRGPFEGRDAVQKFHKALMEMDIDEETSIRFTHGDLLSPNILLTKGPNPSVAAIIDWAQSGWYPMYWEYFKSLDCGTSEHGTWTLQLQAEWHQKYLPLIMDVEENKYLYPARYFSLGYGI